MSRKKRPPELDGEAGWVDEGRYETSAVKPVKAYLDCPTCPFCGSKTGLGPTQHPLGDRSLLCAACGKDWIGTPEQIEQANRADAAWDRRQDGAKGPRRAYVRRRSRKPTEQMSLFSKLPPETMEDPT